MYLMAAASGAVETTLLLLLLLLPLTMPMSNQNTKPCASPPTVTSISTSKPPLNSGTTNCPPAAASQSIANAQNVRERATCGTSASLTLARLIDRWAHNPLLGGGQHNERTCSLLTSTAVTRRLQGTTLAAGARRRAAASLSETRKRSASGSSPKVSDTKTSARTCSSLPPGSTSEGTLLLKLRAAS